MSLVNSSNDLRRSRSKSSATLRKCSPVYIPFQNPISHAFALFQNGAIPVRLDTLLILAHSFLPIV